jgi:ELWxxDGT repeat protein
MLAAGVTTIEGVPLPQVTGTTAEIQSLTPQQISAIGDLGLGVTSLSSDGSVQLNAAQVEALESAKIGITVPSGDSVSLVDIAANIESLSQAQLAGLASLDVSAINATDASLSLTLDQVVGIESAAAAEGSTIPVGVPTGDTVTVAFPQTYHQNLLFDGSDSNGHSGLFSFGGTVAEPGELVGVDRIAGDVVEAAAIGTLGHDILFDGNDLYGNDGLWISDGTAAGTYQITGIANAASAAQGGLNPTDITPFNGEALFFGTGASGTVGLWETNGTTAGTQELISGLSGSGMTVVNQLVYFIGADGGVWETNGTAAGTSEVFGAPGSGAGELEGAILSVPSSGFDSGGLALVSGQLVFGGYAQYTFNGTTIDIRGLFALSGGVVQAVSGIGPGEEQQVRNEDYGGANGPVVVYAPPTSSVPPQAFYQGDNYPGANNAVGGGLWAYNPITGIASIVEGATPFAVTALGFPDPVDLTVAVTICFSTV